MPSYLSAIGTATPDTRLPQMQVAGFMTKALGLSGDESRKLRALYKISGIDYRHTAITDYAADFGEFTFFPNSPGLLPFPTVAQRM
ncbi:MAG: type III polyketide synthase, partial [Chitinophagaceae bacterium]